MTRGQIAIITPEGKILTSIEFNGDMYYAGHGQYIFDELECVDTVEEYKELVGNFNRENFGYTDRDMFCECDDSFFDMQDDYLGKWFSDYVYIKNLSEKPVVFTDAQGKKIELNTGTTAVFNFGGFVACCSEDFETKNFIDKLSEAKENLSYDAVQNYADIWNMCADYDNDHGVYLTDFIMEYDFVDEEQLGDMIKENAMELSRLRCFLGDTYDANLYRLDGYGNLANIEKDDFENMIDDLINYLISQITEPTPTNKMEKCL